MKNYFNLGPYSRSITCNSKEAEIWFNRGLNWCYAFHHKEAIQCFKKTILLDPSCAMGYWGIAYATGPYYNIPWDKMSPSGRPLAIKTSYEFSQKAFKIVKSNSFSELEKKLCKALVKRFQKSKMDNLETLYNWDDDYANAMRLVYQEFPHDYDVCALTAESMMVRTPWQLWDLKNRIPAEGTDTLEAIEIVEKALNRIEKKNETPHAGLLHFYIHIMEMSPEPERALKVSDKLSTLVPDSGHLTHMPSHIYILCGQYQKAIATNIKAEEADKRYLKTDSKLGIYYIYLLHNMHFQVYGAMFSGQYDIAITAAKKMQSIVLPEYLTSDNAFLVNYLEAFSGMKAHVLVRFGKWQEILDEPFPSNKKLFCVSYAIWEYAKGIAHTILGNIDKASMQQKKLREAILALPEERIIFHNDSRDILKVADKMLTGELEYKKENYAKAFQNLNEAVDCYDNLNYSEPWSWMMPPRHALGALLLEQGHVEKAKSIYRDDLGLDNTLVRPSQHPGNVWSLLGYMECCERLNDTKSISEIKSQFEKAIEIADDTIRVSCFCRTRKICCD